MREKFANYADTFAFGFSLLLSIGVPLLIFIFFILLMFEVLNGAEPLFGSAFDRRNAFMEQCLASEQYTREECLILARPQVSE